MQPQSLFPFFLLLVVFGYYWYSSRTHNTPPKQPPPPPFPPNQPFSPSAGTPGPNFHWGSAAPYTPPSAQPAGAAPSQGVPTPCSRCGAPMQLVTGPHLHSNLGLFCAYCRQTEPLPSDAAERVRYLQLRLFQRKQARENDEAPLRTIATLKRAWMPALVLFFAITAFQITSTLSSLQSMRSSVPNAVQYFAPSLAISVALFTGYCFGYVGMARGYRRAVRPLLRARPATAAGLLMRCRSCGGDLPNVHAPEVGCQYCGASNLLDQELTNRASELLQAEIAAYQARAHSVYASDGFRAPVKAFYRWGAAGAVIGAVLSSAALALLVAA